MTRHFSQLESAAFSYPIIDNHAHNFLKAEHRASFPFEGLTSEATGTALADAIHSLPTYRATLQLSRLFKCVPTWEAVQQARDAMSYEDLCKACMERTGIVSLLLDDGLDKVEDLCYAYDWHDRFTTAKTKRIVRVEVLAQTLMNKLNEGGDSELDTFITKLESALTACCQDPEVAGFKSVACYRTGLNIVKPRQSAVVEQYSAAFASVKATGGVRLASKALNDFIVRMVLLIAGKYRKPVQFHTGLGDNDITLSLATPAVMQPVIKEFSETTFVLLHSSYPFTQEAGYLTSVYKNVYLDFGEVFPAVSADGQRAIIRQMLEIAPTNKILWSTDGHWWPETYYLGALQVREALYEVLAESITRGDMTESHAVSIVERVLFHNSNEIYKLGLTPQPTNLSAPIQPLPLVHSLSATLAGLAATKTPFVRLHWVDFSSMIRYRVVPLARLQRLLAGPAQGLTIPKGCMGFVGDTLADAFGPVGEYILVPDLDTLRPPSHTDGHAFIMGSLKEKEPVQKKDGSGETTDVDVCPRTVLKRVVESAKALNGLEFLVGFETEFVLLAPVSQKSSALDNSLASEESPVLTKFITPANVSGWNEASSLPTGSAVAKTLDEIAAALEKAGIELELYHAEAAPGAYEVVTAPLPPLQAVDALIATRQIIFNVAKKHRLHATISPRPIPHQAGTGAHTHISLTSSQSAAPSKSAKAPISEIEASFLQSILDHLPALCAFTLPSPASYTRQIDGIWSGGTWVCWGRDNREVPVRLCGTAKEGFHFEVKAVDGTANPYLSTAALLHAGVLGVRNGLELKLGDCQESPTLLSDAERAKLGIKDRLARYLDQAIEFLRKDVDLQGAFSEELLEKYISTIETRQELVGEFGEDGQRDWMAKTY